MSPSKLPLRLQGHFTALISIVTQNEPGIHEISVTDEYGKTSTLEFEVLDMHGPQGLTGPPGSKGEQGIQGEKGETALIEYVPISIVIAIVGLLIAIFAMLKK